MIRPKVTAFFQHQFQGQVLTLVEQCINLLCRLLQLKPRKNKTKQQKGLQKNVGLDRKGENNSVPLSYWALISRAFFQGPNERQHVSLSSNILASFAVQSKASISLYGSKPVTAIVQGNTCEMKVLIKHQKSLLE